MLKSGGMPLLLLEELGGSWPGSAKGKRRPRLSLESGESLPPKSVLVLGRTSLLLRRPKLVLLDKNPEKLLRPVTSSLMLLVEEGPVELDDEASSSLALPSLMRSLAPLPRLWPWCILLLVFDLVFPLLL